MNQLEALYNVTKQLRKLFNKPIPIENREIIIKQINYLIEQRGIHLEKVNPPYTAEEKVIGKKIVELNESIQDQMNLFFNELKIEMKNIKQQRKSNQSYTNPYKDVQSMDGMFMDSKK